MEFWYEVKRVFYTCEARSEARRKVKYSSNFDLYESRSANWRITLFCVMDPVLLDPLELPEVCRSNWRTSVTSSKLMAEYSAYGRSFGSKYWGSFTGGSLDQGMDESTAREIATQLVVDDDGRSEDLKAFDDSKAGVKGLIDSGITSLPKIFIRPPDELNGELNFGHSQSQAPVIDLSGMENDDQRKNIVRELRRAAEEWGLFQVVNHGIPASVLDGMIDGICKFHEQNSELKKEYYSHDPMRKVRFYSGTELYGSQAANWRDTLTINLMAYDQVEPDELPQVCRSTAMDYINHVTKLGGTLFDLLSEALGVKLDICARGRTFACHYYPPCPQPDLTLGINRHTDPSFLTILLQDQIGGLQILHDNQWSDVPPIPGCLVINIGDLLQIVSNDKFKSAQHRAVANKIGPRISVACFFFGAAMTGTIYGPAKELISDQSPALYREFTVGEYLNNYISSSNDKSGPAHFKI